MKEVPKKVANEKKITTVGKPSQSHFVSILNDSIDFLTIMFLSLEVPETDKEAKDAGEGDEKWDSDEYLDSDEDDEGTEEGEDGEEDGRY